MTDGTGFVFGADEIVADFVAAGTGQAFYPPYVAFGYMRDNELVNGCVFNNWNGSNIELTIYAATTLRREFIRGMYRYVFDDLGANRATLTVPRWRKNVTKMAPKAGFTYEATLREWFGSGKKNDGIVFRLLASDDFKMKG